MACSVELPTILGVVSGLSVILPGILLLVWFGGIRLTPLRNLTLMLASFAVLHGLYHFSIIMGMTALGFVLDFLTSLILVVVAVYYTQRVVGAGLFLLAVSDISDDLRNLVPVMLVLALVLFARLAIKSKSLSSLQTQLSIFLMIWTTAELLRALLEVGILTATPVLQLLGLEIHTAAMLAFGGFLLVRFYRVATRGNRSPSGRFAQQDLDDASPQR